MLRRKWALGLRERQRARRLGLSRPTVASSVPRAHVAGLAGPLPEGLAAATLAQRLLPSSSPPAPATRLGPAWATGHHARTRTGVPLCLWWQEDTAATPEGFQDRWFCQAYRAWASTLHVVMRQSHRAGEQLCVDEAGQGMPVVPTQTGDIPAAALCMAVLGAANSTSGEAPWTQRLPDWMGSQGRPLAALGGGPELVVPAHRKAAVTRAHRSAPALHRTSAALAHPSGLAVLPARAAQPRDQAKGAGGGPVVERWIGARLRHHTFVTLAEVNATIPTRVPALQARPGKQRPGSRHSRLETLDRPALQPWPAQPSA